MHFFHPIQQCAEQIYHTALPLSPTSSCLQKFYLKSIIDDQLSHVTAFIGTPSTWGLLLRTIDTRPRELTCIATSGQEIIAGCGDIVNIYNAVTGVLQQSLSPSEPVTKIQVSPDGSTLFFAHSSSVSMWDVQTGGLVHTFTQSGINDIAVSPSGDYITCGSSNGSVRFWNTLTKNEGKGFSCSKPVVTICWLSLEKFAVTTQSSLCIHSVVAGWTTDSLSFPNCNIWGVVPQKGKKVFLVGTSEPGSEEALELSSFETITYQLPEHPERRHHGRLVLQKVHQSAQHKSTHSGKLMHPMGLSEMISCITPPMGVKSFNVSFNRWNTSPPLLNMAAFMAVSLNRNLVVQTKDSIQIFSTDVLTSFKAHNDRRVSHVYPLDKNYIICVLQPTRHITVLKLETLREVRFDDEISSLWPLPAGETESSLILPYDRLVIPNAMQAWWLGISLDERVQLGPEGAPWALHKLSPARTKIVTAFESIDFWEIRLYDTGRKYITAELNLKSGDGTVYDLTFASETRFYVKMYKPGWHVQIPCDITASPAWDLFRKYTITKGEPMTLSEPRVPPSYTLDANHEWVLDARSRKICWISLGNLRRGNGGHFWAGQWLVMVGDDGVVRKVSFREPDC